MEQISDGMAAIVAGLLVVALILVVFVGTAILAGWWLSIALHYANIQIGAPVR